MDILFQDRRIVVAVKPSGVLSTDEPGGMPALLRQELHTAQPEDDGGMFPAQVLRKLSGKAKEDGSDEKK